MRARTALVICGDGIVAERLCQKPVHTQLAWIAEDRQSDGHAVVTGRGGGAVGSEQPVPPRQIEAEIAAVSLRRME